MGRRIFTCGMLAALVFVFVFSIAVRQTEAEIFEKKRYRVYKEKYARGEILIKFKADAAMGERKKLHRRFGARVKRVISNIHAHKLAVPSGVRVKEMVKKYRESPLVEYAEPNYYAYAFMSPDDPLHGYQWHLDNSESDCGGIQMEAAWDIETGDSTVIVAIIDTGVAYENYWKSWWQRYYKAPDLANTKFVQGADYVENDTHPNDDNSHGTHVAGTVAQSTNNGNGVAGVAFNCSLMPVKVLDRNGSGTYENVAAGIIWATNNGAKVINLSLGGSFPSETLKNAVAYAFNNGVTVIAAAGNDGRETVTYPAAYDDYVIAVGATRYDETRADYSNYYTDTTNSVIGQYVDLAAPGGELGIDQNGDGHGDGVLQNTFNPNTKNTQDFGYWFLDGTSMAAPHVSGVAALLISKGVATKPAEVREALQSTAEDKGPEGWDPEYGWGIVDAYAALTSGPTYSPTNNRPVVLDDSASTQEGMEVTIDVLANDTDADNDSLTVTIIDQPKNGEATINEDETVTYRPDSGFTGEDSFTYSANDGSDDSDSAMVKITVTPAEVAPFPFMEDFESGDLGSYWTAESTGDGRIQVTAGGCPHAGGYHLTMDSSKRGMYSLNELVLTIDLSGRSEVKLSFYHKEFYDENHFMSGSFEGSHHSDGVAVSDDGLMWYKVQGLTGADAISSGWRRYEVDLDAAVASAGITYNGSFKIKFQQYDNYPISTDGFAFDDITVDVLDPGDSGDKPVWQEQELVRLINDIRSQYSLSPLILNDSLTVAARRHSQDMAQNNFLSHTGSDGSSPWDRMRDAGYRLMQGGENVAAGYSTPAAVVNGWMSSPGHRANMLSPNFCDLGVGYAYENQSIYRYYWTLGLGCQY